MKIGIVVNEFPKLSETFILNQIINLIKMGHEVNIFAFQNPCEPLVHEDAKDLLKKVNYFRNFKKPNTTLDFIKSFMSFFGIFMTSRHKLELLKFLIDILTIYPKEILRLIFAVPKFRNQYYDLLHCHFGPNGNVGVILKYLGINNKFIVTFHGYDVHFYQNYKGKKFYKHLFKTARFVTVNSNFLASKLEKMGCPKEKIIKLPMGISLKQFPYTQRTLESSKKIKILTVARLVPVKNLKCAIYAISKVVKKYPNTEYTIVGDGPLHKKLENLVKNLSLQHNVNLVGLKTQETIIDFYKNSHIFLLTSNMEGLAVVLLEAQAMGLPIIATAVGGVPEAILNGYSGYLVPKGDINAIAKKLIYLIEHPEIWSMMGRVGRKFVEEKYDIKKLNKLLISLYLKTLTE